MRTFHAIISILSGRFPSPSDTGGGEEPRERAALLELFSNRRGEGNWEMYFREESDSASFTIPSNQITFKDSYSHRDVTDTAGGFAEKNGGRE